MILRRPQRDYLSVYVGPFHADVWMALGLSLPLVGLALAAVAYVESNVVCVEKIGAKMTALESVWIVFQVYFQQGTLQLAIGGPCIIRR